MLVGGGEGVSTVCKGQALRPLRLGMTRSKKIRGKGVGGCK